jgi:hypothetical protein
MYNSDTASISNGNFGFEESEPYCVLVGTTKHSFSQPS